MGRIVSIIQFTGRAGSAVGSKGKDGKIVIRQYQPTVANPRTAAQMAQRAKMKLAAQVAGMLGEVGRTALVAYGIVLMPKTTEGYNNIGQTGADNRGYVVDLSKVSATNYDFSPCVSAALAVASNGTAEASNGSSASGGSSNTGGSSNSGGNSETPSNGGSETPSGGSDTPPEGGGAVNGEN